LGKFQSEKEGKWERARKRCRFIDFFPNELYEELGSPNSIAT